MHSVKLFFVTVVVVFAGYAKAEIPNGIYSLTRITCVASGKDSAKAPTWIMSMTNGSYTELYEIRDDSGKSCILNVQGTYSEKSQQLTLNQSLASDCNATALKNPVRETVSFKITESTAEKFVILDTQSGVCPGSAKIEFAKIKLRW